MSPKNDQNGKQNGTKPNNDSESHSENEFTTDWPRFLVMEDADKESNSLRKLSPFAIAKGIVGLAGEPKLVKKTSFGLLIEVTKKSHAVCLLKSNLIANIPIKVSPHRTLNTVKGVIKCKELSGIAENEITMELRDQSVSAVKRIMIHKGQQATDTYILTFQKTDLPQSIKVGYLNIRVNPYIPNPLRCYKCQDYGHGANKCTRQERCSRCGQNHANQNCREEPFCVHCHQKHETSDRACQRYLLEKEIQRVKFTEKISFPEARKKVESESARPSYSAAAAKRTKSVETQTTVTYEKDETSPGVFSQTGMASFFPQAASTVQETPDFSQGLIEGLKAGIASNPALGQFVQALFEILKQNVPTIVLNNQDEASNSTNENTSQTTDNQNQNPETKSTSVVLKENKSTSDLPGPTSTEVGPSPSGSKFRNSGSKFPLTPNPNNKNNKNTIDKGKFAPKSRVSGPNK